MGDWKNDATVRGKTTQRCVIELVITVGSAPEFHQDPLKSHRDCASDVFTQGIEKNSICLLALHPSPTLTALVSGCPLGF